VHGSPAASGEDGAARERGPDVVGRDDELARLAAFLDRARLAPAAMRIEGPAGAGKSTLWRAAVDLAVRDGRLLLASRPAGAEVRLAYSAITDLLEPHVDLVLPGLPVPQRRGLERALLIGGEDDAAPDPRAIAAGFLGAVRELARRGPIVVAVDDAQWLDEASAAVIEYTVRRIRDEPVAVLLAWRRASPPPPGGLARRGLAIEIRDAPPEVLQVEPLSLGATQRLLRMHTGVQLGRRMLERIHATSGGNPFYALELARAVAPGGAVAGDAADAALEPIPLGATLGDLLAARLAAFDEPTRLALFVAAAAPGSSVEFIGRVVDAAPEPALRPAVAGAVISVAGDAVEFVHPLLAAASYAAVTPDDRRRWHARIAAMSTDSESIARHVALARPGPDPEVAALLAGAARSARRRGAPTDAADLFEQAISRLTPSAGPAARSERVALIAEAAPLLRVTGRTELAAPLVEWAIDAMPAGPDRTPLLLELAALREGSQHGGAGELDLIDQSIREAGDQPGPAAAGLLAREMWERSMDRAPSALEYARVALQRAEQSGDEALLAEAHVRTADLEVVLGEADDPVRRFAHALELGERHLVDAQNSARSMLAVCLIRAGRVDEARPLLVAELDRSAAEGDEASQAWICLFLAELEWLAGRWEASAAYAAEGLEIARQAGMRMREGALLSLVALVAGSRGDSAAATTAISAALAIDEEIGEVAYANYARQIRGFVELTGGNPRDAADLVATYSDRRLEGSKRLSFAGDTIESLARLGEPETALHLAAELEARGARLRRPTLVAVAARCRALALGGQGSLGDAISAAEEAVAGHAALGLPFEHGRSLLVLGEALRRAKRRGAAREALNDAIAIFDRLGARPWSERAMAERARIGGRTTSSGLSETELRVARLVASGRTNKEVAAELFVSVRAVEANLSRIYAKLGIESRIELARRF